MKILIAINLAWNVVNFRSGLVKALVADDHEVVVATPPDEFAVRVEALGCRFVPIAMDNGGTNVVNDARLFADYLALMRRERPDVFMGYTVKPNVYGSLAAHVLGIPVVNNIAGLGAAFIRQSLLTRVVKFLYRVALARSKVVFFQNGDDRAQFVADGLVRQEQARALPGSGIDLARYRPAPPRSLGASAAAADCHFLLVSRMLFDKGVAEYVEAAARVRQRHPQARFSLLGFMDVANPAAVSHAQMDAWVATGAVAYLGSTDDVRPHIAEADCIVLPSYREGVPRTLLEAAAMARPIVTTDAAGCRDVVDDGVNGLLCRPRDAEDLADKLMQVCTCGPQTRHAMGQRGREKVEREFDERLVIDRYRRAIADATRAGSKARG